MIDFTKEIKKVVACDLTYGLSRLASQRGNIFRCVNYICWLVRFSSPRDRRQPGRIRLDYLTIVWHSSRDLFYLVGVFEGYDSGDRYVKAEIQGNLSHLP